MTDQSVRTTFVSSPDGVRLAVYEGGNPAGPPVVFVHGFSQASLCWARQFSDPLLSSTFRLVAFDLRGHGGSDKPADAASYAEDRTHAADLHAIKLSLGLSRFVLVLWSYAGRLASDYASAFGTSAIAAINFVCADALSAPEHDGPGCAPIEGMLSSDIAINIAATRAFLSGCFTVPPSREEFETALAYNMMVPADVRRHHLSRPSNDGSMLPRLLMPVLLSHGAEDTVILKSKSELAARMLPDARLSIHEGIGHSPFAEDPKRFNRELHDFAASASDRPMA